MGKKKAKPAKSRKPARPLSAKQQRFVEEYVIDSNATAAAKRAGYSPRTADKQGSQLLGNTRVSRAIAAKRKKISQKLEITAELIAEELRKLGFSNMQDYMGTTAAGDPYLDFSKLTRDQAAALSEVTVDQFTDGAGKEAREVRRVKFKLTDKRASLVDLAKLLGLMPERKELTGKDGGPIETSGTIRVEFVKP